MIKTSNGQGVQAGVKWKCFRSEESPAFLHSLPRRCTWAKPLVPRLSLNRPHLSKNGEPCKMAAGPKILHGCAQSWSEAQKMQQQKLHVSAILL